MGYSNYLKYNISENSTYEVW